MRIDDRDLTKRTRRSFAGLGAGAVAAIAGWRWLNSPGPGGVSTPSRAMFGLNEHVTQGALFSASSRASEFPPERQTDLRPNGDEGLDDDLKNENWTVEVQGRPVALTDIQALPVVSQRTEFKCIEGWSSVASWKGVRFADFAKQFAPSASAAPYVALETPSGEYYVGLDRESAMHPQTLLAWELNGKPLGPEHGAPLRLVIPVKYGIKALKRIAKVTFPSERPADFWADRGYDWYSGL